MTVNECKKLFIEIYGGDDSSLRVFEAPGRVNLIGEHTDYNGGFVFPAAITLKSRVIARKRSDNIIKLAATDLPDRVSIDVNNIENYKDLNWGNFQAGVVDEMIKAGYEIVGCDLLYDDTVPHGGGLSSSAAVEVVTALIFATFSNEAKGITEPVNMVELALIGQRAENIYVGLNCGIMDQFASAMGKKDNVILLNCKDLSYKLVPLKLDGYKIVISNTNKKRALTGSKYNERRQECDTGLSILQKSLPNKECLSDINVKEFEENKHLIEDEVIKKRVCHVIYENDRVLRSAEALENGDVALFGKLMIESHNSLRDLYEVTGNELDTLVEAALSIDGVIGSRMTGAGFGGCTVSVVKDSSVDNFIEKCNEIYTKAIGYSPSFYVTEVGNGGHEC